MVTPYGSRGVFPETHPPVLGKTLGNSGYLLTQFIMSTQNTTIQQPVGMVTPDNIYNEDCLQCMRRIPDHSVDLVLCDLPYG